jgi:tRNA pseudouridine38-40 synthase
MGKTMRNLLLTLRFLGGRYCGFQVQKNGLSIAEVVQDAAEAVLGHRPPIKGCSRTDAGVHALGFGLSLKTDNPIPAERLPLAMNAHLPEDVAVAACVEVPEDFHARYSAIAKEYIYRIHNSPCRHPFWEGRALRHGPTLDVAALNEQAAGFIGRHDFSALCSAGSSVENRVRHVQSCRLEREGELVTFTVVGDGFLYNMVRIMVGTLLDIGSGRIPPGSIPDILLSGDRRRAGHTAPAHGLYLSRVFYPGMDTGSIVNERS